MNPKTTLIPMLILTGFSFSCKEDIPAQPNIVLILSDDQAWADTELTGNNLIDTPNLNRIASEGVQMERFFVSPMCAPTRASLMTGRYNLRTGTTWVGRRTDFLNLKETTLADILKSNGYVTGCYGKWHLGAYGPYHPNERGFDDFTGFLGGAADNYFASDLENNGKPFIGDSYITDLLTDSVLHFIEKNAQNPFFCYIPYNVPHHPFQVPEKYLKKYVERGITDPRTASVYAMVDNMDENIGRILDKLMEHNLDKNTIVIFMSDNGPAFPRDNDGLAYIKAQVGEGSVRVPFYIRWKDQLPANEHVFDIAAHIDILPTLLDAAGIKIPDTVQIDGISLLPLLKGEANLSPNRAIYSHQTVFGNSFPTPGGLRTQKFRLMNWENKWELFDMENDPSQKRNLAPENPQLTDSLAQLYNTWYSETTSEGLNLPPVPVGYPGYDSVHIIAPDALMTGTIKYSGRYGWVSDYFVNWTQSTDSVIWETEVYTPETYEMYLYYWCAPRDTGTVFTFANADQTLQCRINKGLEEKNTHLEYPGTSAKPSKVNWLRIYMGNFELEKGLNKLVLQAPSITGKEAPHIKAIDIIKK
jgi:arylsulfatase A-like enzyme